MGFLRDLFRPARPCDLCQLGQKSWPQSSNGVADWNIWGEGLRADLLICAPCKTRVERADLMNKSPLLALAYVVRNGWGSRPVPHAYLQHPEWRKIWMHVLESGGVHVTDEFAALSAIKQLESRFFGSDASASEDYARDLHVDEEDDVEQIVARIEGRLPQRTLTSSELSAQLRVVVMDMTLYLAAELQHNCPPNLAERLHSLDAGIEVILFNHFLIDVISVKCFGPNDILRSDLSSEIDEIFANLSDYPSSYGSNRRGSRFVHYSSVWKRAGGDAGLDQLGEAAAGNILELSPSDDDIGARAASRACTEHVRRALSVFGHLEKAYRLI